MNTPKCVSCGHSQASHDLEHGFCYAGPPRCECDGFLEAVAESQMEDTVNELRRRIKPPQLKAKRWTLEQIEQGVKDFCMAEPKLWCTCGGIFGFLEWLGGSE